MAFGLPHSGWWRWPCRREDEGLRACMRMVSGGFIDHTSMVNGRQPEIASLIGDVLIACRWRG